MKTIKTSLHHSILQTLAYFDLFSYPLTKEELYQWLWCPPGISYFDFICELETCPHVEETFGMYHLSGRKDIVGIRQQRIHIVSKKLRIARRAVKKLRWIPFVRSVFVCNTVASGGVSEESDIDVFIIVKQKRLWLTRFLISVVLGVWRLRRTHTSVANKICLSFYVTDDALDLSVLSWGKPDIYLMYWIYQLIPIYDPDDYASLVYKKNTWVRRYIPYGAEPYILDERYRVSQMYLQRIWKRMWEAMWGGAYGDLLENQAKTVQQQKMRRNTTSVQDAADTRVVVSDSVLKFHENDRRAYYRDLWRKRCSLYMNGV